MRMKQKTGVLSVVTVLQQKKMKEGQKLRCLRSYHWYYCLIQHDWLKA